MSFFLSCPLLPACLPACLPLAGHQGLIADWPRILKRRGLLLMKKEGWERLLLPHRGRGEKD